MGFIRFVFYVVVGYVILRFLRRLFAPKTRSGNRAQNSGGGEKNRSDQKLNTDGIGDYIDYEEVK